jgi:hypothetical protein
MPRACPRVKPSLSWMWLRAFPQEEEADAPCSVDAVASRWGLRPQAIGFICGVPRLGAIDIHGKTGETNGEQRQYRERETIDVPRVVTAASARRPYRQNIIRRRMTVFCGRDGSPSRPRLQVNVNSHQNMLLRKAFRIVDMASRGSLGTGSCSTLSARRER